MKTLRVSQHEFGGDPESRFESARRLAFLLAESERETVHPELVAWIDRASARTSPALEGCGGREAWRRYGISHGGRLEVDVGSDAAFIFA